MHEEYNLYVYGGEENDWLTERCFLCDSVNHIFLANQHAYGWECWNCFSHWWLGDELGKEGYKIVHSKTDEEADMDLIDGNLIFLHGQSER